MRTRLPLLLALVTGVLLAAPGAGQGADGAVSARAPAPPPGLQAAALVQRLTPARVATATIPDLSDVGLLVLGTLPGTSLDRATRDLVVRRHLGGVVLFGFNISSGPQVRGLDAALHRAAGRRGLLVTTDQEGGTVRRVPGARPPVSAAEAGRRGPAYVQAVMTSAGRDLHALGVDVDLAPVADGGGGFLGTRSYGTAPASSVVAAVRGLRAGGEGATAKHFPGLGGAPVSTDEAPVRGPVVRGPALAVFHEAARAGVALIMLDLAVHPGLGRLPSALSAPVYALLRGPKVGFRGVAVTDALDARAATAVGSIPANAVRAVAAGADLVLAPGGPGVAARTIDALQAAVRHGQISPARLAQALARVRALLAQPAAAPR